MDLEAKVGLAPDRGQGHEQKGAKGHDYLKNKPPGWLAAHRKTVKVGP
jgi:hypothetical protein